MNIPIKAIEMRFRSVKKHAFVQLVLILEDGTEMVACDTELDAEVIRVKIEDARDRGDPN